MIRFYDSILWFDSMIRLYDSTLWFESSRAILEDHCDARWKAHCGAQREGYKYVYVRQKQEILQVFSIYFITQNT